MDCALIFILGVIAISALLLHMYLTKRRGDLEKLGIPVDKPGFWSGVFLQSAD